MALLISAGRFDFTLLFLKKEFLSKFCYDGTEAILCIVSVVIIVIFSNVVSLIARKKERLLIYKPVSEGGNFHSVEMK